MSTTVTRDGYPVMKGKHYWLIITGQAFPLKVVCAKLTPTGHAMVKEYDEDAPAWFPQETLEARGSDLFYDYKKAEEASRQIYKYAVEYYKNRITDITSFIKFSLNIDLHHIEAAKDAYLQAARNLFGDHINIKL